MGKPSWKGMLLASVILIVPVAGFGHAITNIDVTPPSPADLDFGDQIQVTFDYETDQADGVRIFPRPMTDGSLTPAYSASGSPLYPLGSGSGSGWFTIDAGAVVVDQIRFQMKTADTSTLLYEVLIDVNYSFSSAGNAITNIVLAPPSPASLHFDDRVDITFDYETDEAGGVRIWARPMTGGSPTPFYSAHGSPLHPVGAGSGTGYFTVTTGPLVVVDQVRFQMWDDSQTTLLLEKYVDVEYTFEPIVPVIEGSWGQIKSVHR